MRSHLPIITSLLLSGCAGATTMPLEIDEATVHEEASQEGVSCILEGTYPVVRMPTSSQATDEINELIQREMLGSYVSGIQDCPALYLDLIEEGSSLTETTNFGFQIELNEQGLLSFTHYASHYLEGAAHPTNRLGALTIDTMSRETYDDIHSLFISDSSYKELLTALVQWQMKVEDIFANPDVQTDFDEWIFYLRPGYLILGNFFEVHALQAMQVAIPLEKLTEVIQENGPLQRLL